MAYPPPYYTEPDVARCWALMRAHPFALVAVAHEGRVHATHVPVLLRTPEQGGAAPYGTLEAHVAVNNPAAAVLRAGAEVLVTFSGPHAYISPAWYVDTQTVPTWNYLAVKARGRSVVLAPEAVMPHLELMVATFETGPTPWRMADGVAPGYAERLTRGIVAFGLDIAELEGIAKLNQNKTAADIASVIAHLRALDEPEARAVAEAMASLPPR